MVILSVFEGWHGEYIAGRLLQHGIMICETKARVKRDKLCFCGAISLIIVLCMIDDDMLDGENLLSKADKCAFAF